MNYIQNNDRSWMRGIIAGLGVAVVTALTMMMMMKAGISPLPQPPSQAFAETLFGQSLPAPVGMMLHAVYVIFWSVIFVRYLPRHNLMMALGLAGVLWLITLAVFFPIIGWGLAGLQVSPKLIPASLMPHLLFGLLLWGLVKYLPHRTAGDSGNQTD